MFFLEKEQEIINTYTTLIQFAQDIANCEENNCPQLSELQEKREDLKAEYEQHLITLKGIIRERRALDDLFLDPEYFADISIDIIEASDEYNNQPGTLVIYPLVLDEKLWLLWAAQGKVVSKQEITNVGREKLNQEVLKLRLLLENKDSDVAELQETAQQLYDWLIKPIEPQIKAGKINNLVFSLDRATRYIPMGVLFDGEQYLIEKYTITTILSAALTDASERLPDNQDETEILGVGASNPNGYQPLPHVATEIDFIVREKDLDDQNGIYPGSQFLNEDFNFSILKSNLRGRNLLHIATHGKFVPGIEDKSYLVWGNGNKFDIPQIKRLRDYLDDVHLVVLSACETAIGESLLNDPKQEEGIEINGLSSYFLSRRQKGPKTVMASLWQVDDASTSQLMQRFYCTLANNPSITKAQALKQAQESLLNNTSLDCEQSTSDNTDFTHPHYWAPFILIGNGL